MLFTTRACINLGGVDVTVFRLVGFGLRYGIARGISGFLWSIVISLLSRPVWLGPRCMARALSGGLRKRIQCLEMRSRQRMAWRIALRLEYIHLSHGAIVPSLSDWGRSRPFFQTQTLEGYLSWKSGWIKVNKSSSTYITVYIT